MWAARSTRPPQPRRSGTPPADEVPTPQPASASAARATAIAARCRAGEPIRAASYVLGVASAANFARPDQGESASGSRHVHLKPVPDPRPQQPATSEQPSVAELERY